MKTPIKPRKKPLQNRSQAMVETIFQATARILVKHGYEGTNTNRIAATAGISVGSIYQYFPNKDALILALWQRHGEQVHTVILDTIRTLPDGSLHDVVTVLVRTAVELHLLDPELHRVLEREFPLVVASKKGKSAHDQIFDAVHEEIFNAVHALLEKHRAEIEQKDLRLATYMVIRMVESLTHAAVLDPPKKLALPDIEQGIVGAITGFLTYSAALALADERPKRRGATR